MMRQFVIAAAIATGLVALWAAIVPLTLSKALFLCRGPNGVDRACTAALARALGVEQPGRTPAQAAERSCHADPATLSALRD
jgi:hypothetical protein